MPKAEKKEYLGIKVPPEMKRDLKRKAKKYKTSMTTVAILLIEEGVKQI